MKRLSRSALAFFPVLLIFELTWKAPHGAAEWRNLLLSFGLGSAVGLSSAAYFYHYFGVANLIAHVGLASLKVASWTRVADLLISPLVGAFWFFPAIFLLPVLFVRRSNLACWSAAVLAVALAAYGASASTNLISAQAGATRYAAWFLAPLWGFLLVYRTTPMSRANRRSLWAVARGAILIMLLLQAPDALDRQLVRHKGRWRPTVFTRYLYKWTGYRDDAETLVEYVLDQELRSKRYFDGVYVWNITPDLSHWIVSKHAADRLIFCMWPGADCPGFVTVPTDNHPFTTGAFPEVGQQVLLDKAGLVSFANHPVLGPYVFIRARTNVPAFHANIPAHVRP